MSSSNSRSWAAGERDVNMQRIAILTTSFMVLAVLALRAAEEQSPPKTVNKVAVPTATKATPKGAESPAAPRSDTPTSKPKLDVKKPVPVVTQSDAHAADESAIRLTGEAFVKAFNAADAKAIVSQFTPDAEFVDAQGNVHQGRDAIQEALSACFTEKPGAKIEMEIESIRFISSGVAVEDGTTMVTSPDGDDDDDDDPVYCRYTAVHVKIDGKWLSASVRDHAPKGRRQHRTQLQQLGWLQGDWVDEDEDSVVIFSCESVDNGNFLLRQFVIQVAGEEAMSGTQRIGWDPLTGKLRAWIFDSEGGYSDGSWHRDEDRWVLKTSGVTADGQTASGTSIYTRVNDHTMTWQLVDHEIAGVQLPDSDLVTIVRRAPTPEIAVSPEK